MKEPREQLAEAIGEVCLEWQYLESIVADMALHLAAYHDLAYDTESVRHPLLVALLNMKVRERILTVKALSHDVQPRDYFDRLSRLLSVIDGDLSIERNRFVHDQWSIEPHGITRFKEGPKVVRPQAKMREVVLGTETVFADFAEVRAFAVKLRDAREKLIELENEIAGLIERKARP